MKRGRRGRREMAAGQGTAANPQGRNGGAEMFGGGMRSGGSMQARAAGEYIKHSQYGCGVVKESNPSRTTIDFDEHGVKLFVTSLMAVEAAEGVPPKRRRVRRVKAGEAVPVIKIVKAGPAGKSAAVVRKTK